MTAGKELAAVRVCVIIVKIIELYKRWTSWSSGGSILVHYNTQTNTKLQLHSSRNT